MRQNLPVTDKEYVLGDHTLIQSRTDLTGIITMVNFDFAEVSGYEVRELIGQPHNIVRHPDTPVELFEDLWKTLKGKRIWSGYLKNRRKDGDFYWVKTQISPHRVHGEITEYVSSRWRVMDSDKERHEEWYRLFREGKATHLKFREGEVVKRKSFFDLFRFQGKASS